MRQLFPGRVARGVLRRLARRTQLTILWAPAAMSAAPRAVGYALIRIKPGASAADRELAEDAMRMADEEAGLVQARLAHGDELFAWTSDCRIVSFGWVTYHHRSVGPVRFSDRPGRVFLYNFFTDERHRGRGLDPALHDAVRWTLAREGVTELISDVNVRNTASRRAIEKAGFVPVGRAVYFTLLNRWHVELKPTVWSDNLGRILESQ